MTYKDIHCSICGDIIAIVKCEGYIHDAICIDCDLKLEHLPMEVSE